MILDTSVLYDSLVDMPLSEQARAVLSSEHPLRAPDLILVEIAGAITRAVRRREISEAVASDMYHDVRELALETDAADAFLDRAFTLSLALKHPISDCVFLAQAEAQADILITADERFVRKLSGTPHAAHVLHVRDWRP